MELGWLTVSSQARLTLFGQVPADPLYSSAPGTDQQSCGDGQSDMWTIKSHCYTPRRFCGWRVHSSGVTPWTMLTRCLFGYAINPKTCWNMVSPTKLGILQTLRKRVVIVVGVACMLLDYLWPEYIVIIHYSTVHSFDSLVFQGTASSSNMRVKRPLMSWSI